MTHHTDHVSANSSAEWGEWSDTSLHSFDAIDERRRYHDNVSALWDEVKGSIVAAIGAVNSRVADVRRVEFGDSPTGGLALTRWSEYPLAFLDVSVDVDSGMIGCLYTFAAQAGDPYRELHKVWLMRPVETGILVTDERGHAVSSLHELARQVVEPYLASL